MSARSLATENKKASIIVPLYKFMVRPHLAYYIPFWDQHVKKNIAKLKKVQKMVNKMISSLGRLPYDKSVSPLQSRKGLEGGHD